MPQQKTGLEDLGFEPAADLTDLGFVRATAEEEKPPQTPQELAMALAEQRASRKSVPGYLEAQRAKQAIEQKRQQTYLATRGLPEAALMAVTGGAALPIQMGAGGVIGGVEGGTPGAVTGAAFPLLGAAASRIPSASRAGQVLERIMAAAKNEPIDVTDAATAVQRARELAARGGGSPPAPIRSFIKREAPITAKFGGQKVQMAAEPMTYAEGFDFASNAGRVSAETGMKMTPAMKRQLGEFMDAMKDANREAAAKIGMGEMYDSAMKEYRQAQYLADKTEVLKKWAIRAAIGAAGYEMWKSR